MINENSLGHCDEDKNTLIKITMLFVIDTDFDRSRNLGGWLNESLFGLDIYSIKHKPSAHTHNRRGRLLVTVA